MDQSAALITLNPFLFRLVGPAEAWVRGRPGLLRLLDSPASRDAAQPEAARART